jgi:hypothetical protein
MPVHGGRSVVNTCAGALERGEPRPRGGGVEPSSEADLARGGVKPRARRASPEGGLSPQARRTPPEGALRL